MLELKKAILDADIKNHGDKIRPPQKPKKEKKPPKAVNINDIVDDPYELMDNDEMPEIVPGLMNDGMTKSKSENPNNRKRKTKDTDDSNLR